LAKRSEVKSVAMVTVLKSWMRKRIVDQAHFNQKLKLYEEMLTIFTDQNHKPKSEQLFDLITEIIIQVSNEKTDENNPLQFLLSHSVEKIMRIRGAMPE
jgi:hypothetical protein